MTLIQQLNTLEATGLVRLAQVNPELAYLFRHTLVQEAAYGSLLKHDRAQLHRYVGDVLERMHSDRINEFAPMLARHFQEAGDDKRALKYFVAAGDAAGRAYANAEAIQHYEQALHIATRDGASGETLAHLYSMRGRALEVSGQYDRALESYEELERLARARGDRRLELAALIARAKVYAVPSTRYDSKQAIALAESALSTAHELGDREAEAKVHWVLLNAWPSEDPARALEHGEKSLALARELKMREQTAFTLHNLGEVYADLGQIERGLSMIQEAQQLWRELGNLPMLNDSLSTAATFHFLRGNIAEAIVLSHHAYQLSVKIGDPWGLSYSIMFVGVANWIMGEMDRAISAMEECIQAAERGSFLVPQIFIRALLALAYGSVGAYDRAYAVAETALVTARQKFPAAATWPLASLGRLHILTGRLEEAEAAIVEASARQTGNGTRDRFQYLFAVLAGAELSIAVGHYADALKPLDVLVSDLRSVGILQFVPDALYVKAVAQRRLGLMDEAYVTLVDARVAAEAVQERRLLWQILTALSEIHEQRGQHAEAHSLRRQARETIEYIAGHIGQPELRQSFLSLPDVQAALA